MMCSDVEAYRNKETKRGKNMKIIKIMTARLINGRNEKSSREQRSTSCETIFIKIENSHKIQKQFAKKYEKCLMPSSILRPVVSCSNSCFFFMPLRHSSQGTFIKVIRKFLTCFRNSLSHWRANVPTTNLTEDVPGNDWMLVEMLLLDLRHGTTIEQLQWA